MTTTTEKAESFAPVFAAAAGKIRIGFCKHVLAQSATGAQRWPTSPDATMWCVSGAICAALHVDQPASPGKLWPAALKALAAHISMWNAASVIEWNNAAERTQQDVVDLLERAAILEAAKA